MILEVDNIHCYYGLSHVLHGVSLKVDAGEIVSLLGRNGAGKTTTILSIMGLVRPRSGVIRLAASTINGRSPHEICQSGVGWAPQGRRLFPHLTVKENIHLATLKDAKHDDQNRLERVYTLFPHLLERRDSYAGNLSGGEQQMLTIARALVGRPRVLLLDEPTEGLAPLVVADIMEAVREISAQGAAVLLAEQNIRVALSIADRHYILDKGEVRVEGTTVELENREDILSEYLGVRVKTGQRGFPIRRMSANVPQK